jgi:methyltransferase-like protein/2-polyprenyl-3-methyl-5-hydroxy-6-metoxy-1,4-benzoquinol methylase
MGLTARRKRTVKTSYDHIPYPSLPYAQTHPDNLATVATLLGVDPPSVGCCRLLELGCASGGNLIPMAYGLPNSEFVGVDSSSIQIAQGQTKIESLRLTNIDLNCLDIMEVDAQFGQFDYIIAHGVYSWVVPQVQDRILEICRKHLAPTGIAYISYNTYPNWGILGTFRDMMLYHTRHLADPKMRAKQARDLLYFFAEATSASNSAYSDLLKNYSRIMKEKTETFPNGDSLFLHDELEEVNDPVYFHQFVGRAMSHDLQYLAEAEFSTSFANKFSREVAETLVQISKSSIEFEQYLDFLTNRSFRQTLLCHREIPLTRELNPERLMNLYFSSSARPVSSSPTIHKTSIERFRAPNKATLSTDHPLTKSAILFLAEVWPQTVSFKALLAEAFSRLGLGPITDDVYSTQDVLYLRTNLLKAHSYSSQLMKLHTNPSEFTLKISERPVASAVARYQVRHAASIVTNCRHERVRLSKFNNYLLRFLDGNHDRTDLLKALEQLVTGGILEVKQNDQTIEDARLIKYILAEELELRLQEIAQAALLIH